MNPCREYRNNLRWYARYLLSREVDELIDRPVSNLTMGDLEAICELDGVTPPVPPGYRPYRI
jgi:hypothetical protein